MGSFTLNLHDWTIDYLFARVHRVTNLSGLPGGGFSSSFGSSPGSFSPGFSVSYSGLNLIAGIYDPNGASPGAISFGGTVAVGAEQYNYNNAEGHAGYSFLYQASPTTITTFTATWSPTARPLSYALSTGMNTTAVPAITTLGSGSSAGSSSVSFSVDLSSVNDFDHLIIFYVYGGSRGLLSPTVDISGYRASPMGLLPPVNVGLGPIALFRSSGLATSISNPGVIAGSWLMVSLVPPTASFSVPHPFKSV